jgi:hypothetical protein
MEYILPFLHAALALLVSFDSLGIYIESERRNITCSYSW